MTHRHQPEHDVTALRFRSADTGRIFIFKNPFDRQNYSFELLDTMTMLLDDIDENIRKTYHLCEGAAVEQLVCRIRPQADTDSFAVGYDEIVGDLYESTEEAAAFLLTGMGIRLDVEKNYGKDVYLCSAIKPNRDYVMQWKLELFRPAGKGRRHA